MPSSKNSSYEALRTLGIKLNRIDMRNALTRYENGETEPWKALYAMVGDLMVNTSLRMGITGAADARIYPDVSKEEVIDTVRKIMGGIRDFCPWPIEPYDCGVHIEVPPGAAILHNLYSDRGLLPREALLQNPQKPYGVVKLPVKPYTKPKAQQSISEITTELKKPVKVPDVYFHAVFGQDAGKELYRKFLLDWGEPSAHAPKPTGNPFSLSILFPKPTPAKPAP